MAHQPDLTSAEQDQDDLRRALALSLVERDHLTRALAASEAERVDLMMTVLAARSGLAPGAPPTTQEVRSDDGDASEPYSRPMVETAKAWPDGHYYSPIPDLTEVRRDAQRIFGRRESVPGVDLALDAQLRLLPRLAEQALLAPFLADGTDTRYQLDNDFFGVGDALAWFGLLRLWQPRRVIEVGSGWSSAVLLDARDCTPHWAPELHFVEPYPERLHSLLRDSDDVRIVEEAAQSLDPEFFAQLEAGDVLFIDSTHVSRVGSDVNYLLLEVLPRLARGVHVHVHDIHFPFEYPQQWIYEGRAWNEAYLLRALLTDSTSFRVSWWNSALAQLSGPEVAAAMPAWQDNPGASLYLERI